MKSSYDQKEHFEVKERSRFGAPGILYLIPKDFPADDKGQVENPLKFVTKNCVIETKTPDIFSLGECDVLYGRHWCKYSSHYTPENKKVVQVINRFFEPARDGEEVTHLLIRKEWGASLDKYKNQIEYTAFNKQDINVLFHIKLYSDRGGLADGVDYVIIETKNIKVCD